MFVEFRRCAALRFAPESTAWFGCLLNFFLLKFWSWLWNTHSECLGRQLRHVSVCFIGDEGSIVTSSKFGKTVTLDQFIVNVRFV